MFVLHFRDVDAPTAHELTTAIHAVRNLYDTVISNITDGILTTDADEGTAFIGIIRVTCER